MRLLFLLRLAIFIFIVCWAGYNQTLQKSEVEDQIVREDERPMRDFSKTVGKIYNPGLSDLITKKNKFRDF